MKSAYGFGFATALAALAVACAGSSGSGSASGAPGTASVSLDGTTYEVDEVAMTIEPGEDAWFRIEGEPVEHRYEDCVPGLGGGLGLYGDLPSSVRSAADLEGQRLRVDFSGDGDDANLCFVGMNGLAGAEEAWITIKSVKGDRVSFTMSGTFTVYDENGDGVKTTAKGSGTAVLRANS